jgi:hypothetical protein
MPPAIDRNLLWLIVAVNIPMFGYFIWKYVKASKHRPHFNQSEVVYEERSASGASQKNLLTKVGGARNCLRLVVTKRFLWITARFPFSLFSTFYDLEHVIPVASITRIEQSRFLGQVTYLLTYTDDNGRGHMLRLRPKDPQTFIQSLDKPVANSA